MQHVQDQYFEFLDALGVPHEPVEWDLGPWPEERAWQREFLATFDRPIASDRRRDEQAGEGLDARAVGGGVRRALSSDFGLQPVLVGGRSARELAAERIIMERASAQAASRRSAAGCGSSSAILDASALVLSPDTGPLHMAVALDRPVISLMGYTNPKRTGPYRRVPRSDHRRVRRSGRGLSDLDGESAGPDDAHRDPSRCWKRSRCGESDMPESGK